MLSNKNNKLVIFEAFKYTMHCHLSSKTLASILFANADINMSIVLIAPENKVIWFSPGVACGRWLVDMGL